jgi:hypothetical protein
VAVKPEVAVKITADPSGFVKGATVVQGSLAKLQAQMTGFQAVAAKGLSAVGLTGGFTGITVAATAVAGSLAAATKAAVEYGNQLDATSQRTGVSVENLAKLQYAAKLSETSAEALTSGLVKLAPKITAAAADAPESAKLFQQFGIAVRNTDGTVRGAADVLEDLADVFSTMPEGPQKTALAVEFFGKKMGAELIPLLNQGKEGLKALGDEAERLGLVLNEKQTKAAAELDDNLDRLAQSSRATSIAIGNLLIPSLNKFLNTMLETKSESTGFLSFVSNWFDKVKQAVTSANEMKRITGELASLQDKIKSGKASPEDRSRVDALNAELEAPKKAEPAIEESNTKRLLYASQLAGKLEQLEKLRAIAAGEASIDILKSDKDLNEARLKDAEKLRDALRDAYQSTKKDAISATDEAIKLLDKAREKRQSVADKKFATETKDLAPEDQAHLAGQRTIDILDEAAYAAAAANAAKLDGRLEVAAKHAKQAEELIARAESFAEKSGDINLIEQAGEAQARIYESQAAAKKKEAADLDARAASQMAILNEVESKIKNITTTAANFEIKANITQLESDIARLKKQIGEGAVMPVTVSQIVSGGASGAAGKGASGEFSSGGFTGWRGRSQIAGVVHGMEYVTPAGVTMQPGVIPFLEALRRYGNKVLPGYEKGGLVSDIKGAIAGPRSAFGGNSNATPLVLDFGKLGRFNASASANTAEAIEMVFKRAALQFGRR